MEGGKNQVSRRRFLKKAAVATPAVAAASVLGVQGLVQEIAATALDHRDVAGRESGKVFRLAAAG